MSGDERHHVDRDALALLRAIGSDTPAPAGAVRNVLGRLAITLPAGTLETAVPESMRDAAPLQGAAAEHAPLPSSDWVTLAGGSPAAKAIATVARPWAWALGLTIAGGVSGGALHAVFAPEKVRVVYIDRSTPQGSISVNALHSAISAPEIATTAGAEAPASPTDQGGRERAPSTDSSWSKERALLDSARRALAAGEPQACLTELGKHARAFPSGKLAEEREAMTINALVGVARYSQAREKAALFSRRYPHSFLTPSVEAAISAIP
jgi:hypothetical protein